MKNDHRSADNSALSNTTPPLASRREFLDWVAKIAALLPVAGAYGSAANAQYIEDGSITGEDVDVPGRPSVIINGEGVLDQMFLNPYSSEVVDTFSDLAKVAAASVDALRPRDALSPPYLGLPGGASGPDYSTSKNVKIADRGLDLQSVVNETARLFDGMPEWNHPFCMPNVVPPPNKAAILATLMTAMYSPNLIEGEYAWNVDRSEIEVSAMLADLVGWDQNVAGGIFTFGGTGCYLYGVKWMVTNVLKGSRSSGIRSNAKLLMSYQGHYVKYNISDWCGLGMDNIIQIKTNGDDNTMDMNDLERVVREETQKGNVIIGVVCTTGTTDVTAIDDVGTARTILNRYPNPSGYGKAMIYCDAVIGWVWLMFKGYDWTGNPLGIDTRLIAMLQANYNAISRVSFADAIGCDFHKVGWSPYNSSVCLIKKYWAVDPLNPNPYPQDQDKFQILMRRPASDYLQARTSYNPGLYTLETSRSASYSMSAWATMKYFGKDGFRSIASKVLAKQYNLRELINTKFSDDFVVCNESNYGFQTIIRVYPLPLQYTSAKVQYDNDLNNPTRKSDLIRYNQFQESVSQRLWNIFRTAPSTISIQVDGSTVQVPVPYVSLVTGFRPTNYNLDYSEKDAMIYGIKLFPLSVSDLDNETDYINLMTLILYVIRTVAKKLVDEGWEK